MKIGVKMKPAAIIACLFVLALNGSSSAQTGPAAEQVRYDWNRDGHMDKAMLVESNEDESVSLHIHFGRPNGRFAPPIIATNFAGSSPMIGDPAHIKLNAANSIVVTSSHIGIGRSKYEADTLVAFRGGQMKVVGYKIARWDAFDPEAATSCDVNFSTGRAVVLHTSQRRTRVVRHNLAPVPIRNWKMLPELRGTCPAYD